MICYCIKYRGPDPNLIYYTIATGKIRQKARERSNCKETERKKRVAGNGENSNNRTCKLRLDCYIVSTNRYAVRVRKHFQTQYYGNQHQKK